MYTRLSRVRHGNIGQQLDFKAPLIGVTLIFISENYRKFRFRNNPQTFWPQRHK